MIVFVLSVGGSGVVARMDRSPDQRPDSSLMRARICREYFSNGEVLPPLGMGSKVPFSRFGTAVRPIRRWISENSKANKIETMKGPAESGEICSVEVEEK